MARRETELEGEGAGEEGVGEGGEEGEGGRGFYVITSYSIHYTKLYEDGRTTACVLVDVGSAVASYLFALRRRILRLTTTTAADEDDEECEDGSAESTDDDAGDFA